MRLTIVFLSAFTMSGLVLAAASGSGGGTQAPAPVPVTRSADTTVTETTRVSHFRPSQSEGQLVGLLLKRQGDHLLVHADGTTHRVRWEGYTPKRYSRVIVFGNAQDSGFQAYSVGLIEPPTASSVAEARAIGFTALEHQYPAETVSSLCDFMGEHNPDLSDEEAEQLAVYLLDAAALYELDYRLLASLIAQESRFYADAVSPVGASGLGQLMPETAADLGVSDVFDPQENLMGAADYLSQMLEYTGSVEYALAAYNAGPGAVDQYGGIPPYDETINYVHVIGYNYRWLAMTMPEA